MDTVFDPGDDQNNVLRSFIPHLPERSKYWTWKQEDESTLTWRNTMSRQSVSLPNIEVEAAKSNCTLALSLWWSMSAHKFPTVATQQALSPTHNRVRIKILQLNSVISIGNYLSFIFMKIQVLLMLV